MSRTSMVGGIPRHHSGTMRLGLPTVPVRLDELLILNAMTLLIQLQVGPWFDRSREVPIRAV